MEVNDVGLFRLGKQMKEYDLKLSKEEYEKKQRVKTAEKLFQREFEDLASELGCHTKSEKTYGFQFVDELQEDIYDVKIWYPLGMTYSGIEKILEEIEDGMGCTVILKKKVKRQKFAEATIIDEKKFLYKNLVIPKCNPWEVFLGKGYDGQDIIVDISESPHIFLSGTTGVGKSKFLLGLILSIAYNSSPEEVELYLFQPAKMDLSFFKTLPQTKVFTKSVAEMVETTDELMKILKRRMAVIEPYYNNGLPDNIKHFNEKVPQKAFSYIFVVTDEASSATGSESGDPEKELKDRFKFNINELSKTGRSAGIYLINSLQRGTVDQFPSLTKSMSDLFISFRQNTRKSAEIALGDFADLALGLEDRHFVIENKGNITYGYTENLNMDLAHKYREMAIKKWKKSSSVKKLPTQQEAIESFEKEKNKKRVHEITVTKEDMIRHRLKKIEQLSMLGLDTSQFYYPDKNKKLDIEISKNEKEDNKLLNQLEETTKNDNKKQEKKKKEAKKDFKTKVKIEENDMFDKVGNKQQKIGEGIKNFNVKEWKEKQKKM